MMKLTRINRPLQLNANFPLSRMMSLGTDSSCLTQSAVPTICPTTLILLSMLPGSLLG